MEIIIGGRRCGKTTKLLEWVKQAKRTKGYPFWDRIVLVHRTDYAQTLRIKLRQEAEARQDPDASLYYNMVYSVQEWKGAHLGRGGGRVAVMIDNLDLILHDLVHSPNGSEIAGYTFSISDQDQVTLLDEQGGSVEL